MATRANEAWEALLRAHATLMKEFAAADIWQDLSMREYDVLYTLSKCPAPTQLGELHRHVLLSQPALSRLVERLVSRGLVRRVGDPDDGRRVLLSLTDQGRTLQQRVGRQHARGVAAAVTRALTPAERTALAALCAQLTARAHPPSGASHDQEERP